MKLWRERITEAETRGRFTAEDRRDAGDWNTCAVGEQQGISWDQVGAAAIREFVRGVPVGEPLFTDGAAFFRAVLADQFHEAMRLLDAIEDRALVLKRSIAEAAEPRPSSSESKGGGAEPVEEA